MTPDEIKNILEDHREEIKRHVDEKFWELKKELEEYRRTLETLNDKIESIKPR